MVLKGGDKMIIILFPLAIAGITLPNPGLASIDPDSHGCFYSDW